MSWVPSGFVQRRWRGRPCWASSTPSGFVPISSSRRARTTIHCGCTAKLDGELLLDLSINDGGIPDTPPPVIDGEWTVFVQDTSDLYLAEVVIESSATFTTLATKLRDLLDSVARGERPLFEVW